MNTSIISTNPKHTKFGQATEIKAYKTASPALIVHRGLDNPHSWTITHTPTQAIVYQSFQNRATAILAANQLAELTDWAAVTMDNCCDVYKQHSVRMLEIWNLKFS